MIKQYGMLVDRKRCIGCEACTIACKTENGTPIGVNWHRVLTIGGKHKDTPAGTYPNLSMSWLPVPCMHCQNPPCERVCPTAAITRRADGIVLIDKGKCIGCQYCVGHAPMRCPSTTRRQVLWRSAPSAPSGWIRGSSRSVWRSACGGPGSLVT